MATDTATKISQTPVVRVNGKAPDSGRAPAGTDKPTIAEPKKQTGASTAASGQQKAAHERPEFVVSRKELLAELSDLQRVVDRRCTIPILGNILIEAGGADLTLTATDLDLSLRTTCPARIKTKGGCTVPARKLHDYVKLLPEDDISIKVLENSHVQIKSGRSHTKMVGLPRDNFPRIARFPENLSMKLGASMMRELIKKSLFAVSGEESRYTLNGCLLVLKPDGATMVATDGHRLAHIECKTSISVQVEKQILLPKKAVSELASQLSATESEHIRFAMDDSSLFFLVDGRLLTSRQLSGTFPNFAAVLPTGDSKSISLPTGDLLASIQRVSQFADERSNAVRLQIRQGEVRLSSSSAEAGESEESIEAKYKGDGLVMAFNSQYLTDFLKAAGSDRVRFQFKEADKAAELQPESSSADDYQYRYVVMPMRS